METKVFNDVLDLWVFIFENAMDSSTTKMSDEEYSKHIDKLFDNVCKGIKENGKSAIFNYIVMCEVL